MSWLFVSGGRSIGASASVTVTSKVTNSAHSAEWPGAVTYPLWTSPFHLQSRNNNHSFTVLNGPHIIYHLLDAFENNKRTLLTVMLGIGMGNTCKSMADSCQCMTKTTTILWSNYPPTDKNKCGGEQWCWESRHDPGLPGVNKDAWPCSCGHTGCTGWSYCIHTLTVRVGSIILILQMKKLPIITEEVDAATWIFFFLMFKENFMMTVSFDLKIIPWSGSESGSDVSDSFCVCVCLIL